MQREVKTTFLRIVVGIKCVCTIYKAVCCYYLDVVTNDGIFVRNRVPSFNAVASKEIENPGWSLVWTDGR